MPARNGPKAAAAARRALLVFFSIQLEEVASGCHFGAGASSAKAGYGVVKKALDQRFCHRLYPSAVGLGQIGKASDGAVQLGLSDCFGAAAEGGDRRLDLLTFVPGWEADGLC